MRVPPPEEMERIHHDLLEEFIKDVDGLTGMILIGIRDKATTTAIEIRSAARLRDVYRGAASALEAVLRGDDRGIGSGRVEDPGEAKLLSLICDVLLAMAGDNREDVERLELEFADETGKLFSSKVRN